jgi:hypothetical protein
MTFQTILIIHADKVSAENKNFFLTKAWVFTRAYCFETQKKKTKSHLIMYLYQTKPSFS